MMAKMAALLGMGAGYVHMTNKAKKKKKKKKSVKELAKKRAKKKGY